MVRGLWTWIEEKKKNPIEKAAAFIIIMIPTRNIFNRMIVKVRDQWK